MERELLMLLKLLALVWDAIRHLKQKAVLDGQNKSMNRPMLSISSDEHLLELEMINQ